MVTVKGCRFIANQASTLMLDPQATQFYPNTPTMPDMHQGGGGLYLRQCGFAAREPTNLDTLHFEGNVAYSQRGGGLHATGMYIVNLYFCNFTGNVAAIGGGVAVSTALALDTNVLLQSNRYVGNQAITRASGIQPYETAMHKALNNHPSEVEHAHQGSIISLPALRAHGLVQPVRLQAAAGHGGGLYLTETQAMMFCGNVFEANSAYAGRWRRSHSMVSLMHVCSCMWGSRQSGIASVRTQR